MNAAKMLVGVPLPNGWQVMQPALRGPSATGGFFSSGYLVQNSDGRQGFLKAMDYSAAFQQPKHTAEILNSMTNSYLFERQVCEKCRDRQLRKVVHAVDAFTIQVDPNNLMSTVECLVFERADGDIRAYFDAQVSFDLAFVLRTLHHVATGLEQLHRVKIAHQDLKPSNVLVFANEGARKIGDLGRAWSEEHKAPHDDYDCAGDAGYAPPELLYKDVSADVRTRRFGCDAYHLGSLIVYMFARTHMTSLFLQHIYWAHRPGFWQGSYADVLPYVHTAFADGLREFEQQVHESCRADIVEMVTQLCQPDPCKRGHPQNGMSPPSQFGLERYISRLDLLAYYAETSLTRRIL